MKPSLLFLILCLLGCQLNHKSNHKKKTVIAHRGASGYLPEHTLASKKMALEMGADYVEQDIVLSRDDVPIVIHDIYLDEVTNVKKQFPNRGREDGRFYVMDFSFEELKQLEVKERFDHETGEQVYPDRYQGKEIFLLNSLSEEIEFIQAWNQKWGKNVGIYPEIKKPAFHLTHGKDISSIVLKTLTQYGYKTKKDKCILQCFDTKELQRIREELQSELFLVQLIEDANDTFKLKHFASYADGIGPWYRLILSEIVDGEYTFTPLVKEAHDLGLIVHPFTFRADQVSEFDSFREMVRVLCYKAGVDGGFTDHPDLMIKALK